MSERVCLDLFAGVGGFSAAFEESDEWEVVTVDINEEFDPDICADVMDLRPVDLLKAIGYDRDEIDVFVVLASPPCTAFSLAASRYEKIVDGEPRTDEARNAVALVYHTIGLTKALSPDYWFIENPRGYLRQFIGDPVATVTYCQYGTDYMKPTDLWGRHPPMTYRRCTTGSNCHAYNTDLISYTRDPAERAKVPYELSEAIKEAVETAYANPPPEQVTIQEALT